MMRTALVKDNKGNLRIMRYDGFDSNAEVAEDLRDNDYTILKIWKGYKSEKELDEWYLLYRAK